MPPWDVVPVIGMLCTTVVVHSAILLSHRRKVLQLQMGRQQMLQASSTAETDRFRQEFYTLRESITAHALMVDDNVKALASRMSVLENRVSSTENNPQQVNH
jgi:hypothetical protein